MGVAVGNQGQIHQLEIPPGLTDPVLAFPTVYIDTRGMAPAKLRRVGDFNEALYAGLRRVHESSVSSGALLKVHVGEPKCVTRMRPEYMSGCIAFLHDRGASHIVAGDTTVAYTGPRGHKQNRGNDASAYLELAREHGWSINGEAGVPFVVLDRPRTAPAGPLQFRQEVARTLVAGVQRYRDFHLAGGFDAAGFVVNHAHATLHGLAGFAGCVKSLAMGCSSLEGKLRMHQSLFPCFDEGKCTVCGRCVESCPEDALSLPDGASHPTVDRDVCIGCGECEAVCAMNQRAIRLQGKDITDWQRGGDTLPLRMTDYTVGLMNGRWENTIHILHVYSVTEHCDCLNVRQDVLLARDIGFLVGKNPFALDRLAAQMVSGALDGPSRRSLSPMLPSAESSAMYARREYGILVDTPIETITLA